MYSPRAVTTSNVVAVPKSTTIAPCGQRSCAATELTIRSAPTSRGFSLSTGTPVLIPGPTTSGSSPRWTRHRRSTAATIGGTTDDTATALTAARSSPARRNSSLRMAMYSSAVRPVRVSSRQSARRLRPASNSPSEMLVLPTSTANSKAPSTVMVGA